MTTPQYAALEVKGKRPRPGRPRTQWRAVTNPVRAAFSRATLLAEGVFVRDRRSDGVREALSICVCVHTCEKALRMYVGECVCCICELV